MKIAKKLKNWVKNNKVEIICYAVGGTMILIGGTKKIVKGLKMSKLCKSDYSWGDLAKRDNLKLPDIPGMECLEICKDGKNGFILWLKNCRPEDMGKLGEGISKIEGLTPGTTATMVTLRDCTKE